MAWKHLFIRCTVRFRPQTRCSAQLGCWWCWLLLLRCGRPSFIIYRLHASVNKLRNETVGAAKKCSNGCFLLPTENRSKGSGPIQKVSRGVNAAIKNSVMGFVESLRDVIETTKNTWMAISYLIYTEPPYICTSYHTKQILLLLCTICTAEMWTLSLLSFSLSFTCSFTIDIHRDLSTLWLISARMIMYGIYSAALHLTNRCYEKKLNILKPGIVWVSMGCMVAMFFEPAKLGL